MEPITSVSIVARQIRHPQTVDPLPLIKTLEDILSFPSVECTLQTTQPECIDSENYTFVILVCNGEEKSYIMYLKKNEDKSHKCIGYDPLTAWDGQATITRH